MDIRAHATSVPETTKPGLRSEFRVDSAQPDYKSEACVAASCMWVRDIGSCFDEVCSKCQTFSNLQVRIVNFSAKGAAAVEPEMEVDHSSDLSCDVLELIFLKLPQVCVVRAASVCKQWKMVTQTPTFPWLYIRNSKFLSDKFFAFSVGGVKHLMQEQAGGRQQSKFLFTPSEKLYSDAIYKATVTTNSEEEDGGTAVKIAPVEASGGGLHHAFTGSRHAILRYKVCLLEQRWRKTSVIPQFVLDPIVGLVKSGGGSYKVVMAGGVPLQIEEDDLAVSVYDEEEDTWEHCQHLPLEFRGLSSSMFMNIVVHERHCFAYDMYSGFVSRLDLESKRWSAVAKLRPPGVDLEKVFLASMSGKLHVVGVQYAFQRKIGIDVWEIVDEFKATMRVGNLVQRSAVVNPRLIVSSALYSAIARWASSAGKAWSRVAGYIIIVVIEFVILCYRISWRTIFLMQNLFDSAISTYAHFSRPLATAAVRPLGSRVDSGSNLTSQQLSRSQTAVSRIPL